jgi:hypothetical protein
MTSSVEEMVENHSQGRIRLEPGQTVPAAELLALLDAVEFACLKLPMKDPLFAILDAAAAKAVGVLRP